jgi:hypothetical protein
MRQTVYAVLARLLPTSAVDRAVRNLTRAAEALAAAETAQLNAASKTTAQIQALRAQREAQVASAARAGRIADRLSDLTA